MRGAHTAIRNGEKKRARNKIEMEKKEVKVRAMARKWGIRRKTPHQRGSRSSQRQKYRAEKAPKSIQNRELYSDYIPR